MKVIGLHFPGSTGLHTKLQEDIGTEEPFTHVCAWLGTKANTEDATLIDCSGPAAFPSYIKFFLSNGLDLQGETLTLSCSIDNIMTENFCPHAYC